MKKRVYSGIRATGRLHLGNYMGAVKGMLALQDSYDCIFSVVDLHTITVPYDPKTLQQSVRDIVLDYLAAGLNPKKCHLEIQSKVPAHVELAYLLSTIYPVSRLEDLPTYKDKKAQYPKYVNMGLLYYPVLMAADIMLYKAELVPVGIDQEPHLEVQREIARKFNSMFGDPSTGSGSTTFPECKRFSTKGEYVPSLTGLGKMSKSVEGSYINLTDDIEMIRSKVAKIPTDEGYGRVELKNGRKIYISLKRIPRGVANLARNDSEEVEQGRNIFMEFVRLFLTEERVGAIEKEFEYKDDLRYADLKLELSEAIYKELQPFQKRRKEFENNPKLVDEILEESNAKCKELAEETMREVRGKMGLTYNYTYDSM